MIKLPIRYFTNINGDTDKLGLPIHYGVDFYWEQVNKKTPRQMLIELGDRKVIIMIEKLLKDYKKMKKDALIKQLTIKTLILDEIEDYCSLSVEEGEFSLEESKWLKDFNNDILEIIKHKSKIYRAETEIILRGEDNE